jgi:hypothetical protein
MSTRNDRLVGRAIAFSAPPESIRGLRQPPHGKGVGQSNEIAKMFLEIGGNLNEAFK